MGSVLACRVTTQHTRMVSLLERATEARVTPGAVLAYRTREGDAKLEAVGARSYGGPSTTTDTLYDAASLTKVTATLPSILRLVAEGEIALSDRVDRFFSAAGWFRSPSLAEVTIEALLRHDSGLPSWLPLYASLSNRRTALAAVLNAPIEKPGEVVYSDLGFMLLGAIVERVSHQRLDAFARSNVFEPLGMYATTYLPEGAGPFAPTEDCGWRDRLLEGEVHDENATVWDGVSGHAGLFSTAPDLLTYAHAWLARDARLGPEWLLETCTREYAVGTSGERRGLGWMLGWSGCPGGPDTPETSFGHTGFTGTSMWIEPEAGIATVLLTNRVHPRRGSPAEIAQLRKDVHTAVRTTVQERD